MARQGLAGVAARAEDRSDAHQQPGLVGVGGPGAARGRSARCDCQAAPPVLEGALEARERVAGAPFTRPPRHSLDLSDALVSDGELRRQRRVVVGFGGEVVEVAQRVVDQQTARGHCANDVVERRVDVEEQHVGKPSHVGEAALGAGALTLGDLRLAHAHERGGEQARGGDRGGGHRGAMAAGELGEAVAPGGRMRNDRQAVEMAFDVGRELGGAAVALGAVRRERALGDALQVAAQAARLDTRRQAVRRALLAAQAHRAPLLDLAREGLRALAAEAVRAPAGEQHVQQDAERVDVGGGGERHAAQLLGTRPLDGQRARCAERRPITVSGGRLEQLGDPEVQQLRCAVGIDEHIGGFQIPVQDELLMREADRAADHDEEAQTGVDVERAPVAVAIDGLAGDVLEHQVWHALGRCAAVDEVGDVGMHETGEDAPLGEETLAQDVRGELGPDELDRHGLREGAVVAPGPVDGAHAAAADLRLEQPRPDPLGRAGQVARQRPVGFRCGVGFESENRRRVEPRAAVPGRGPQPVFERDGNLRLVAPEAFDHARALLGSCVEQELKRFLELPELLRVHRRHRRAQSGRRGELGGEERLRRGPLAPGGGGRDRERLRHLVERQADEEAQLDDRHQPRIERLELVERRIDRQHAVGVIALGPCRGVAGRALEGFEWEMRRAAAALLRRARAGPVDQHVPHGLRGDGEEMGPRLPLDA